MFLPGVQTIGGAGNARASTISGLPQNTINISIDGVNAGNNLQSTDGFFSLVTPRLDAVEEVTHQHGHVRRRQQRRRARRRSGSSTRSGTNQFTGEPLRVFPSREPELEHVLQRGPAGLPKPRTTINTYGGRVGGPIVIPGLFDGHDKAFFFFNQEEVCQPNEQPAHAHGHQRPGAGRQLHLQRDEPAHGERAAAGGGQRPDFGDATRRPSALLNAIRASTLTHRARSSDSSTNPNTRTLQLDRVRPRAMRHSPTGSVDFNLSQNNHLRGTYYWQRFNDNPDTLNNADPTFPGFPAHAHQDSYRTNGSVDVALDAVSPNLVNEVLSGWQWSPVDFFADVDAGRCSTTRAATRSVSASACTNAGARQLRQRARVAQHAQLEHRRQPALAARATTTYGFGFSFTRIRDVDRRLDASCPRMHARVRHDQRSGARHVHRQRPNFPTRLGHGPDQRARVVRAADGPRHRDSRQRARCRTTAPVRLQRAT